MTRRHLQRLFRVLALCGLIVNAFLLGVNVRFKHEALGIAERQAVIDSLTSVPGTTTMILPDSPAAPEPPFQMQTDTQDMTCFTRGHWTRCYLNPKSGRRT